MESLGVPRLRGVFHQYAFFVAVVAGVVLVVLADGYLERFAVWVYAAALAAMFGASALYHRFPWRSAAGASAGSPARPRDDLRVHRGDVHAVRASRVRRHRQASSCSRPSGREPPSASRSSSRWIDGPRWLSAIAYLAVGWVGVIALPQLFPTLGVAAAVLVIVGGALYTLGALSTRRPGRTRSRRSSASTRSSTCSWSRPR